MERLLQKQTFVMQEASKEHAPHPMFFAGNQVYFISDKPHSLMMISLLVTSLPMNSRNSPAAEPRCRETDSWRATPSRTWAPQGFTWAFCDESYEKEREREREKLDPKGASCEFLLFCCTPHETSLGDATHLTFAGKTSDGDYLLIIHYSYASCSKLSRYAQGDKALVTFSLLAVSTSSPMPPNTKAYSASKHAKCPTSSLFLYQPDQIAPSRLLFGPRIEAYLYSCVQKDNT